MNNLSSHFYFRVVIYELEASLRHKSSCNLQESLTSEMLNNKSKIYSDGS